MSKTIRNILITVAVLLVIGACIIGAVIVDIGKGSHSTEKTTSTVSAVESEISPDNAQEENSTEISQASDVQVSETSDDAVSENNDTYSETEISDISNEVSQESSEPEPSQESQEDGYFFDDEQIVEDYHTAQTFTDDETFNSLFQDNIIDKAYNEALKDTVSITDMRKVTIEYAEKWNQQALSAYEKLKTLLSDKPQELEKLEDSQNNWLNGLAETENEFYRQASTDTAEGDFGSQLLLSADTAMMNYYKGRAAVLYQQIFTLTETFEME